MSRNTSCIFYLPPWTHKTSSKYVIDGNFPLYVLISTYTIISRWIWTICHSKHKNKEQTMKVIPTKWLCGCSGVTFHSKWKRLTKLLQSSYQHKQWTVQPVAGIWYLWGCDTKIARVFFCTNLKYMWSLGGTKKNKYIYVAHKSVTDSNIE